MYRRFIGRSLRILMVSPNVTDDTIHVFPPCARSELFANVVDETGKLRIREGAAKRGHPAAPFAGARTYAIVDDVNEICWGRQ